MPDKTSIKLSDLHTNPDNPRLIKDDKFKKLVASIKDFPKMMALRPIVVDDTMTILGGNMRYNALREAGFTEIDDSWVKQAKDLTPEEKKQFIIKDNLPFGEWDWDILANNFEIKDLLDWGFDEKDLKIEQDIEEDEVPEVSDEPAISKLGEVYQLGRHRLMCGDSTKIEDVEKLMDGKKADMVFTDPPYGDLIMMNARKKVVAKVGKYHEYAGHGDFDFKPCWELIKNWECKKVIWGGNYFANYLPITTSWIIWDKRAGEHSYFSDCELAWSNIGTPAKVYSIVWQGMIRQGEHEKRVHPTQKPIELATKIMEGELIVDLFGGSGSTLIACEQTNRICYMMEIDPRYIDVIRKRYAKFIGKENEWETITPKI
jgi:DNA modification methylase